MKLYLKDLSVDSFTFRGYEIAEKEIGSRTRVSNIDNNITSCELNYLFDNKLNLFLCGRYNDGFIEFFLSDNLLQIVYFDNVENCEIVDSVLSTGKLVKDSRGLSLDFMLDIFRIYYDKNNQRRYCLIENNATVHSIIQATKLEYDINKLYDLKQVITEDHYNQYVLLNTDNDGIFTFQTKVNKTDHYLNFSKYAEELDITPTLFSEKNFLTYKDRYLRQYKLAIRINKKLLRSSEDRDRKLYFDWYGNRKYARFNGEYLVFDKDVVKSSDCMYFFNKEDLKMVVDYLALRLENDELVSMFKIERQGDKTYQSSIDKIRVANIEKKKKII